MSITIPPKSHIVIAGNTWLKPCQLVKIRLIELVEACYCAIMATLSIVGFLTNVENDGYIIKCS
jgi:hypothetical protein